MDKLERIEELYKNHDLDVRIENINEEQIKIMLYDDREEVCAYIISTTGITIIHSKKGYYINISDDEVMEVADILNDKGALEND